MDPSSDWGRFLSELKRRKVFRVAAVYAATAFVVWQASSFVLPALGFPDWSVDLVVVLSLLGFPIALVLAWAFEVTPEGVRRAEPAPAQPAPGQVVPGSRRVLVGAGAVLAVLLGAGLAAWYLGAESDAGGAEASRRGDAAVSAAGADGDLAASGTRRAASEPSIAVLPFDNLGGGEENEYFSDGMTEDVLTQLSRIAELRVISRQSVMRYEDSEKGMGEIARELGASHVVEGSVRRSGGQVRVTAQLIDARNDRHLWAETYDRELSAEAVFRIQSEIARRVAEALQARLSRAQREELAGVPTGDLTAYDYYLKGRERARRGTRGGLERAAAFYRQAIARDSGFARAYAALAWAYTALEGAAGAGTHWLDSARIAAERAVELDPRAAEGHSALALVYWSSGRMAEGLEAYERALELRPNDPEALWGLAFARWHLGELDVALRLAERAAALDPASAGRWPLVGRCYMSLGAYDRAENRFRRALRLQPDNTWAHDDLIRLYIATERYGEAAEQLRTARALLPNAPDFRELAGLLALAQGDYGAARAHLEDVFRAHPDWSYLPFAELGFAYTRLGEDAGAREMWSRGYAEAESAHRETSREQFWAPRRLARIAAPRGDREEALRWLEAAYARGWRGWPTIDIREDPLLESLRGDPRFERLRTRILEDVERMRARVRRRSDGGG